MREFFVLARRELLANAISPAVWVLASVFLLVSGLVFRESVFLTGGSIMDAHSFFFGGGFNFWFFLIILPAVFTMRVFALERASGTIETLMTAPVTDVQVVLSKFCAALATFVLLWLPTGVYYLVLDRWGGAPDVGPILASYLGVLGVGAVFTALGCLTSSLTTSQPIAFFVAATGAAALLLAPQYGLISKSDAIVSVSRYVDLIDHFGELARGVVDPRRFLYYSTLTAVLLFLTVRVVEARKWR